MNQGRHACETVGKIRISQFLKEKISVAPMMGYSDVHARYFWSLMGEEVVFYSEMIVAQTLKYNPALRSLLLEHPSCTNGNVLQLGGANPHDLAQACCLIQDSRYTEINFNVGCPSRRVQSGAFGAVLMKDARHVALCFEAMSQAVDLPISVKHRIGVDDHEGQDFLFHFVETLRASGCRKIIVHGRKALLKGLTPKENRSIPPLNYPLVYALKKEFPDMYLVLNGGIQSLEDMDMHLKHVNGVMLGRVVLNNPYVLVQCNGLLQEMQQQAGLSYLEVPQSETQCLQGRGSCAKGFVSRETIFRNYRDYVERQSLQGIALAPLIRPLFALYHGEQRARAWRKMLDRVLTSKNIAILDAFENGDKEQ